MRQAVTAPERGWEWRARGGRRWGEGGGVCQPADRSGQEEPNTHIPPPHPFPHSFHPSLPPSLPSLPSITPLASLHRLPPSLLKFRSDRISHTPTMTSEAGLTAEAGLTDDAGLQPHRFERCFALIVQGWMDQ